MQIDILSLFPDYFSSPFKVSIIKRAIEKGLLDISLINIRDFAEDKHKRVDNRPYGGGPGMVMSPGPCVRAIRSVKHKDSYVVYLTPQGSLLNAKKCEELSSFDHLILLCGHYEGIDQRAIDLMVDEELSIGDYVLTNGCIAAIAVLDSLCRFIPGVLGNEEAAQLDSFQNGKFEAPLYTRPETFEGKKVPKVLMEGDHEEIAKWREREGIKKTRQVRPEFNLRSIR